MRVPYGTNFNKNDERYTPKMLIRPILKYIPKNKIVWCPFDKDESNYVKLIKEVNPIVNSHWEYGQNFFRYMPDKFDLIVTNVPFSLKFEILNVLYKIDKPFCVLMPVQALNYQNIMGLVKDLQLFIFDKKVSFDGNTAAFAVCYFCYKFLPKDLIVHHLEHNNTGKFWNEGN